MPCGCLFSPCTILLARHSDGRHLAGASALFPLVASSFPCPACKPATCGLESGLLVQHFLLVPGGGGSAPTWQGSAGRGLCVRVSVPVCGHLRAVVEIHVCCQSLCGLSVCGHLLCRFVGVWSLGISVCLCDCVCVCVCMCLVFLLCLEVCLNVHFSGIVNLYACLCLRVCVFVGEYPGQLLCVTVHLCVICVCLPRSSSVHHHHHPPRTLPGYENLAGFGVMGWPGPGAGGRLGERREA